tara:strand:+ start:264 stop:542 length:279 start_codon:yes stop_codon:yes gene_type:complete
MQKINQHADRYINFNDPDSIANYCPEDQFEYVPDDPTIKDHILNFLFDYLVDPLRMQLIKRFNIFKYKPARGVDLLNSFEASAADDLSDFED